MQRGKNFSKHPRALRSTAVNWFYADEERQRKALLLRNISADET